MTIVNVTGSSVYMSHDSGTVRGLPQHQEPVRTMPAASARLLCRQSRCAWHAWRARAVRGTYARTCVQLASKRAHTQGHTAQSRTLLHRWLHLLHRWLHLLHRWLHLLHRWLHLWLHLLNPPLQRNTAIGIMPPGRVLRLTQRHVPAAAVAKGLHKGATVLIQEQTVCRGRKPG